MLELKTAKHWTQQSRNGFYNVNATPHNANA